MTISKLPDSRRQAVLAIRKLGTASVADLAEELVMTPSGARQAAIRLIAEGWVERVDLPGSGPRPRHGYRLTDAGKDLFVDRSFEVASSLLEYIRRHDPELYGRAVDWYVQHRRNELSEALGAEPRGRLQRFLERESSRGLTAEPEDDGSLRIFDLAAPNREAFRAIPELCELHHHELQLAAGGRPSEVRQCIRNGSDYCMFWVGPDNGST